MDKRGLSHIEIIMSFVIFIGFLIFAFYFFNPLKADRVLDASLYYTNDEILKNVSVSLESYSVILGEPGGISGPSGIVEIPLNATIEGDIKVRVENYNGVNLSASYSNNVVNFDSEGNDFVKIMFSEVFPEQSFINGGEANYTIASSNIESLISEKRVLELKDYYENSYPELKAFFNIPNRIDFGFQIIFNENDSIIAEKEIPQGIKVLVQEKRIEVIREGGEIVFTDLIIKVW